MTSAVENVDRLRRIDTLALVWLVLTAAAAVATFVSASFAWPLAAWIASTIVPLTWFREHNTVPPATLEQSLSRYGLEMNSRLRRAIIDVVVAGFFVVLFATREGPDYALDSIIGLVALVPIGVHLWPNRHWIKTAWSRLGWRRKIEMSRLNLVLATSTTICTLTGIPAWIGADTMNEPHAVTGFIAIGAAIVHGFRNRSRFRALAKRPART